MSQNILNNLVMVRVGIWMVIFAHNGSQYVYNSLEQYGKIWKDSEPHLIICHKRWKAWEIRRDGNWLDGNLEKQDEIKHLGESRRWERPVYHPLSSKQIQEWI